MDGALSEDVDMFILRRYSGHFCRAFNLMDVLRSMGHWEYIFVETDFDRFYSVIFEH